MKQKNISKSPERLYACIHVWQGGHMEKACQITTRRGLKADSHCVGIREAEEALAHIREWDFSHVDNRYSEEACPGITGKSSCLGTGIIFWTWTQGEANFCFHWAIHTAGPALPRHTLSMWSCVQRFWCRWELISERRRAICRCLFRG